MLTARYTSQFLVTIFLFISFPVALLAQKTAAHVPGKILIVMEEDRDINQLTRELNIFQNRHISLQAKQLKTAPLTVWALHFDPDNVDENRLLYEVRIRKDVKLAQFDHIITERIIPDDPQFSLQWQYMNNGSDGGKEGADLDMELAWDLTTGGTTLNGDTIVVCIIDGGMDQSHQDFEDNLWVNYGEIPGNGIDDDNNGYIDDYFGWSVYTSNDNVFNNNAHGTSVAGIVGAKGNNGKGVAGVNWNVKLMIIRGGGLESLALESYAYPYKMRKLYNETNGEKGAFVVATNASWGTDLLMWQDAPIWCAFYDTLGSVGIINCGATTNSNVNVDVQGDMPTSCPSNFLISVTNLNRADNKVSQAGYGLESVDLGAYGQGTYTTTSNNSYTGFGGTSGATPHVSGVVALIYSLECELLAGLTKENPPAAALFVKDLILGSVVPNESLAEKTVTGGRLNAFNPLLTLENICGTCAFPFSVRLDSTGADLVRISWDKNESHNSFDVLIKPKDASEWDTIFNVQNEIIFDMLEYCKTYQLRIRSNCVDTFSVFSFVYEFTTDGCCVLPKSYDLMVTENQYTIKLDKVIAAENYEIEFKKFGEDLWFSQFTETGDFVITTPDTCDLFYFRYKTLCTEDEETQFSPVFQARGHCENCEAIDPCKFNGSNAFEYIDTFYLEDFVNVSGKGKSGHEIFKDVVSYTLESGKSYKIGVKPGFVSSTSYKEYIKAYLDYNFDGILDENELVMNVVSNTGEKVEETITIPKKITSGTTTLRILMFYNNATDPCENVPFGEVEDYCIALFARSDCLNGNFEMDTVYVSSAEANLIWKPLNDAGEYTYRFRLEDGEWHYGTTSDTMIVLTALEECTWYDFELSTDCSGEPGDFSDSFRFRTDCTNSTNFAPETQPEFSLAPNPFNNKLVLKISGEPKIASVHILNALGQELESIREPAYVQTEIVDLTSMIRSLEVMGILFVVVRLDNGFEKMLKAVAH